MIKLSIKDKFGYIKFGNLIYYIAYNITLNRNDINVYIESNNKYILEIDKLFTNVQLNIIEDDRHENYRSVLDRCLNSSLNGFNVLKEHINKDYLNSFQYDFDISNICVINARLGDYFEVYNSDTYKFITKNYLKRILEKYVNQINSYDNIIVVTDSSIIAKKIYDELLKQYITKPIIYYHTFPIYDFNLLLNSKFIIGSCSTFSFSGCVLNYNNAKSIFEFPYYLQPNPRHFDINKQSKLYDYPTIIKEC